MEVYVRTDRGMQSQYQIEHDIQHLYWSYGMLQPDRRVEWWVIKDSDGQYRFYEFAYSYPQKTVQCTQTFASSEKRDVERFMRKNARIAYILFRIPKV